MRDTNDLGGALERIGSDLRSYYLSGYAPHNESFDGRFRKISVRVRRKGVEVSGRSGYFAVRSAGPVLANVAPALAVLESGKRPHALEVSTGASVFPAAEGPSRVTVVVTMPWRTVARLATVARPKGLVDVTLLSRILDASGQPVDTMSRRFSVKPGTSAADLLLLRDSWLPSGEVLGRGRGLRRSLGPGRRRHRRVDGARELWPLDRAEVVIVKGAVPGNQMEGELDAGHPLRFGDVVLLPLGGQALASQPPRPLIIQVTVPPSSSMGGPPPQGTVAVWNGSKSLGQSTLKWAPADASGLVRFVGEVPTGSLTPGRYELRVTLSDSSGERTLTVPFAVAE